MNQNNNLAIQLVQQHGMSHSVATHLVQTYGGRAHDVCHLSSATNRTWPRYGVSLTPGLQYPYIDAEVRYACREYACTVEDVLSRRTRLAFLNQDAAKLAIPMIADIMTEELGWTQNVREEQIQAAVQYLEAYGGRVPRGAGSILRNRTYRRVKDVFDAMDTDGSGFIDVTELHEFACSLLCDDNDDMSVSLEEVQATFAAMDVNGNGRVDECEFAVWWNDNDHNDRSDNDYGYSDIHVDALWLKLKQVLVISEGDGHDDDGDDNAVPGGAVRGGSYMFG
mmetsp:Transcript_419/g.659  ORF Transcript_419/g.659 Transcript_419/m.659 type:complete len:280 (+) Transcript_419:165-1004(+)